MKSGDFGSGRAKVPVRSTEDESIKSLPFIMNKFDISRSTVIIMTE